MEAKDKEISRSVLIPLEYLRGMLEEHGDFEGRLKKLNDIIAKEKKIDVGFLINK